MTDSTAILLKQLPITIASVDDFIDGLEELDNELADPSDETLTALAKRFADHKIGWVTLKAEALRVFDAGLDGATEIDPGLFRVTDPYMNADTGGMEPGMIWTPEKMPMEMALWKAFNRCLTLMADMGDDQLAVIQLTGSAEVQDVLFSQDILDMYGFGESED